MNEIIITSRKSWQSSLKELWDYKEVFFFLGWRDIIVHYKQTAIGVLWVILRPILTVAVFTIIFSKIAGISSGRIPYALIVFAAMLAWQFFADMLAYASLSFLGNEQLISKVYFPRIMLPASRLLCAGVDFGIAFFCYLLIAVVRYHYMPSVTIFFLPLFAVWLAVFSLTTSLLFATLIVRYRDFRHILPFVTQLGIYCTPVGFSFSMVPHSLRLLLSINPLAGIINGFRFCLLGEKVYGDSLLISLIVTLIISVVSIAYFKSAEEYFADII
jgi:lipopolysaccharide transport system permease protein